MRVRVYMFRIPTYGWQAFDDLNEFSEALAGAIGPDDNYEAAGFNSAQVKVEYMDKAAFDAIPEFEGY